MDPWEDEDMEILKQKYPIMKTKELALLLGKSNTAVVSMANRNGIKKAPGFCGKKIWQDYDDAYLKQHYAKGDLNKMCNDLKCSRRALYARAFILKLMRDSDMIKEARRIWAFENKDILSQFQFKKGSVSWNTGKKQVDYMTPENIEKTKKGRFKPGNIPWHQKPIGTLIVHSNGDVFEKVKEGCGHENWARKNRLEYEKHFGSIPEGAVIEVRDGNKMNWNPENLVLKTKRENLLDNGLRDTCILKRYMNVRDPEEIQEFIENHSDLIEMKRNEVKLNGRLKKIKSASGTKT
jgi:hypothetical protein